MRTKTRLTDGKDMRFDVWAVLAHPRLNEVAFFFFIEFKILFYLLGKLTFQKRWFLLFQRTQRGEMGMRGWLLVHVG